MMVKDFHKTYRYSGEIKFLVKIIEKIVGEMNLEVINKSVTDTSFKFSLSEKMKWTTTNWPVHFDLEAHKDDASIVLNIKTGATMWSITQNRHTKKKAEEFLHFISVYAPNIERQP